MKYKLILLGMILISPNILWSTGIERMQDIHLLGIDYDSAVDSSFENVLIMKAESLRISESGSNYHITPFVLYNFLFKKIPNIRLYHLSDATENNLEIDENYLWILANKKDSTIYRFGQGILAFTKVIKDYISITMDTSSVYSLVELYINTISANHTNYILKSGAFFERIVLEGPRTFLYSDQQAKIDIAKAYKTIKAPVVKRKPGQIDIKLYTWDEYNGDLIYWNFVIKDNDISLKENKTIKKCIGPYNTIIPR
jgi:hypothetical protein